jgi:glycolate oxidase FAD binding subunit
MTANPHAEADAMLAPKSAAEVAEAVRWALEGGIPLEISGTGTKRDFGRPVQAAHGLDLSALDGIIAYEPEELVLTAHANTGMHALAQTLAARGQQLAFEPPDWGTLLGKPGGGGTLAGVLSCGLAGPRRIKAGSARDHLLGLQAVNGRAELFRAGGKVVKNVTGYDLPKLVAGAFGTLVALTEVTVKVLPAPERTQTLLLMGLDAPLALAAMTKAFRSPYEVSGAAHLPNAVAQNSAVAAIAGAGQAVTAIRVEGFGPSVAARVAVLRDALRAELILDDAESVVLWREIANVDYFAADQAPQVWRLSVPPADAARVAEMLSASLDAALFFDWAGGLIWAAVTAAEGEDVSAAVRAAIPASGHATLVRASATLRAASAVFPPLPDPLLNLNRRVKASFDPRGLFNPGRMYAGL